MATSVHKPKIAISESVAYRIIVNNAKIIENTIFNIITVILFLDFCYCFFVKFYNSLVGGIRTFNALQKFQTIFFCHVDVKF